VIELTNHPTLIPPPVSTHHKMFRRKQPVAVEENVQEKQPSDEPKSTTVDEKVPSNDPPPVSFFRLFRFATKGEILLNCVGIVCAIAAGAAQVRICSILDDTLSNGVA